MSEGVMGQGKSNITTDVERAVAYIRGMWPEVPLEERRELIKAARVVLDSLAPRPLPAAPSPPTRSSSRMSAAALH